MEFRSAERLFLTACTLIVIGSFTFQLAGTDPSIAVDRQDASARGGSMIMQFLLAICYVGSGLLLLRSGSLLALLRRTWPIFLLPLLAFLSMAWSPEPYVTFRKAVAFLGTVILGLTIAERLSYDGTIRLIAHVTLFAVVFSVVWVFVFPHFAVHQVTDAWPYQKVHAGSWRGVFAHRTMLGYVAGLAFALIVYYGPFIAPNRFLRFGLGAVSLVCLVMANSGGGFLTAVGVLGLLYFFGAVSRLDPRSRLAVILVTAVFTLIAGFFADTILSAVLELLGKQPDLTGRLPYWLNLLDVLNERPLFGYGYYAGFAYEVGIRLAQTTGSNFSSTHNGYLSVIASFGYVGLAAALFMLAWLGIKSIRVIMLAPSQVARFAVFPAVIVVYALGANMIEDSLSSENDLIVLVLAAVGGLVSKGIPVPRFRRPAVGQPAKGMRRPALAAGSISSG